MYEPVWDIKTCITFLYNFQIHFCLVHQIQFNRKLTSSQEYQILSLCKGFFFKDSLNVQIAILLKFQSATLPFSRKFKDLHKTAAKRNGRSYANENENERL